MINEFPLSNYQINTEHNNTECRQESYREALRILRKVSIICGNNYPSISGKNLEIVYSIKAIVTVK